MKNVKQAMGAILTVELKGASMVGKTMPTDSLFFSRATRTQLLEPLGEQYVTDPNNSSSSYHVKGETLFGRRHVRIQ